MYYDFTVDIPDASGKLTFRNKKSGIYVYYEYGRDYDPVTQMTNPKRSTIGKLVEGSSDKMVPNENFWKYFPETDIPELKTRAERSACLKIGNYIVISKIIDDYGLKDILGEYMSDKDVGLFLDLATYAIVEENNAAQHYPAYTFNHPLFTEKMKQYSDSTVSDLFRSIGADERVGFLNSWNAKRDHRERIYISYDSTNKNCQAGDIDMVEFGHPKDDRGFPIFNQAIAYDTENKEPLFYTDYPGSINDVSQLQFTLDAAKGYGYKKVGFILDRGYFSGENIRYMDKCGYNFIIMVKGMKSLVSQLVLENEGTFEKKRSNNIYEYGVYGKTVKRKLYETDEKERYFHIYHSVSKENSERAEIEDKINKIQVFLNKHLNEKRDFGPGMEKYFYLHHDNNTGAFVYPEEKASVVETELRLAGYFVIITSEKMKASEAIRLYKSRDISEKLFRSDKSFLGDKSVRVHSSISAESKLFVLFIALIIRCRIYNLLKDEMLNTGKKHNYMTVPATIRELEKIEMVRGGDGVYRLDHAVTATQKEILKAFGLDEKYIKYKSEEISNHLRYLNDNGQGGH